MVGTGTFWLGNIRAFDRVVGLDGKEAIVASVTDDTHIVLFRNWAGTTQASAAYEIWMSPDEIFLQTLTRAIFEALQSSALTGISGLTPASNTFPFFNSIAQAALASIALGATDNRLVRSDGAGGASMQGSSATLDDAGVMTINANGAALPAPPLTGTALQVAAGNGLNARITLDAFGGQSTYTMRRANGTPTARTALASGDLIGGFAVFGSYDATNYAQQAALAFAATENWSGTNRGTEFRVYTTPNGSTAIRQIATFGQDASLTLNANSAAAPPSVTGAIIQSVGADGVSTRHIVDTFNSQSIFNVRRAGGTAAARSALATNDIIGGFYASGAYDATNYSGAQGLLQFAATEVWTSTNRGTLAKIQTTPSGSTTSRDVAVFGQDGVLTLPFGQIAFPATQNPSSDANTLDDYEEGTFTPSYSATGATFSYIGRTGSYTKIGRLVHYDITMLLNTSGNTLSVNALTITGLPFSSTGGAGPSPVRWGLATSSYVNMTGFASGTNIALEGITAAGTTSAIGLACNAALHATNGSSMRIIGVYQS
jgi:hypothetical protein